jgi:hypothetical protein
MLLLDAVLLCHREQPFYTCPHAGFVDPRPINDELQQAITILDVPCMQTQDLENLERWQQVLMLEIGGLRKLKPMRCQLREDVQQNLL